MHLNSGKPEIGPLSEPNKDHELMDQLKKFQTKLFPFSMEFQFPNIVPNPWYDKTNFQNCNTYTYKPYYLIIWNISHCTKDLTSSSYSFNRIHELSTPAKRINYRS